MKTEKASVTKCFRVEESRIHDAYGRRAVVNGRYSWFQPGHLFTMQQLERRMLFAIRKHGFAALDSRRILEVGCGNGYWLRQFIKWGANPENLTGVDLLESRVLQARKLSPPEITIQQANAAQLSFAENSFDLVFQAMVFTSIFDYDLKREVAAEMVRVVKHDGLILWYDFLFNNPQNPDVRGVKKKEIVNLFPNCRITLERVTLAPPVARRLASYSWIACYLLEQIPWLRTHYLGAIRKNPAAS